MGHGIDVCECCGRITPIGALDAKPRMTRWLRVVQFFLGQHRMLSYAASRGYDFEVLECRFCYGPAFELMA